MPAHSLFPELLAAHREIQNLVTSLEVESDAEVAEELREELLVYLAAHMAAEDQVIVPALRARVRDEDKSVVLHESGLDHEEMWRLAVRVYEAEAGTTDSKAAARALNKIMTPHMEEEENETYFLARQVLPYAELADMIVRVREQQAALIEQARVWRDRSSSIAGLYPELKERKDGQGPSDSDSRKL